MDTGEKREETASASTDDRRYSIVVVSQVKAATAPQSKPKSWHVFVGRLDPSITADDVKTYLEDASFVDIDVRSLRKRRNGRRNMLHSVLQSTLKRKT